MAQRPVDGLLPAVARRRGHRGGDTLGVEVAVLRALEVAVAVLRALDGGGRVGRDGPGRLRLLDVAGLVDLGHDRVAGSLLTRRRHLAAQCPQLAPGQRLAGPVPCVTLVHGFAPHLQHLHHAASDGVRGDAVRHRTYAARHRSA